MFLSYNMHLNYYYLLPNVTCNFQDFFYNNTYANLYCVVCMSFKCIMYQIAYRAIVCYLLQMIFVKQFFYKYLRKVNVCLYIIFGTIKIYVSSVFIQHNVDCRSGTVPRDNFYSWNTYYYYKLLSVYYKYIPVCSPI